MNEMAPTEHAELVGRLERALDRGSRLLAITHGLQAALRPADVADVITHHARAALGTYFAGIALVDPDRRTMAYLSMSPLPDQTARAWQVIPLSTPAPVTAAVRTGRSFFLESIAEAEAAFPGIAAHMRTAGTGAMAHLPLISGSGERLGTLALSFATSRRMSASEREFMTTLAGYTSQAIERALLFEQKLTVAEALQGSVLPTRMPRLEHWEVLGRFEPGAVGMEVGGDWFDAFTLPDGRLACAVGDATGHGLRAARVMSAVRNALRAYAVLGGGPATVLTRLDDMLFALQPESMATVLYLELDPSSGEGLVSLAGHPPPLLWSPEGATQVLDLDPDPPLGCVHDDARRDHPVRVGADELLLLFTDGLVERRDEDIFLGLARLASTLTDIVTPAVTTEQVLEQVLGKMIDASSTGDDVCALVVRHTRDAPAPAARRTHLPPRAHSVGEARRLAREALTEWGVARRRDEIVLAVSELVTNAVTHAETSLTLQLEVLERAVRVTVVDQSPALPEHQLAEPAEEHGRGVHLVELVSDRWGATITPDGKCVWAEFDLGDGAS
ncbi:MAG: SpoIIE family protein phosphatase [Kineosporiaceae bacterium]|nr:SpoIIE family protein phosphatase [Kineosporiaceae bacterium]